MVLNDLVALIEHHFFALAHGLLANLHVLGQLTPFALLLHKRVSPGTQALGHLQPRESEHQRAAHQAQHNRHQARTGKAQPAHAPGAQGLTQHTSAVSRQQGLKTI